MQLHLRRGDASSKRSTHHWAQPGEVYDDNHVDVVVVVVVVDVDVVVDVYVDVDVDVKILMLMLM